MPNDSMVPEIESQGNPSGGPRGSNSVEARVQRLEAQIFYLRNELTRVGNDSLVKGSKENQTVLNDALATLKQAEITKDGSPQLAWSYVHQVNRQLFSFFTEEEIQLEAKALRNEAQEKLKNWRLTTVLEILENPPSKLVSKTALIKAQKIVDEHFDNMYHKLQLIAGRLRWYAWTFVIMLVFVIGISAVFQLLSSENDGGFILYDFWDTLIVLVIGAIGSVLSHALQMLEGNSRIPQLISSSSEWFIRLPLGALSAFALVVLLQGALSNFVHVENNVYLYGYALAAGFSDRLLNNTMKTVEKSITEK